MGLLLLVLLILAVLLNRGTSTAGWRRTVRRALGPALRLGGIGCGLFREWRDRRPSSTAA